jgi:hypothetical protein
MIEGSVRDRIEEYRYASPEDKPPGNPKFDTMTAEEVLPELRVILRTLFRYHKSRKLTVINTDGRWLFQHADVLRFKEKRKIRAKQSLYPLYPLDPEKGYFCVSASV